MAKKTAAPAPKVGSRLVFKSYEDLGDMDPIFAEGDILIAKSVKKDGDDFKIVAYKEEDGEESENDTLYFPAEVDFAPEEDEETEDEAPKKTAAKKAPVKKTAKAPVVEEDDEDEEELEDEDDAEEESVEASRRPAKKTAMKKVAAEKKAPAKSKDKAVAKAPARTKDEEASEELHHSKSVQKILKKGDMLEAAKNLVSQAGQSYYNLGGVLAEIYVTKAYADAGYTGEGAWEEYLNAELGIEYRKAMDLIGIYKTFSKLDVDEEKLFKLGYTKMRAISRIAKGLTSDELDDLLNEAEDASRDDLEATINDRMVDATKGTAREKIRKVNFKFSAFGDEAEYIENAIDTAKNLVESGEANDAIIHIFREWGSMADGVEIPMDQAIKALEDRFNITLQVVDPETGEEVKTAPAKKVAAKKVPAKSEKKAAPVKPKTVEKKAPVKGKKKAA